MENVGIALVGGVLHEERVAENDRVDPTAYSDVPGGAEGLFWSWFMHFSAILATPGLSSVLDFLLSIPLHPSWLPRGLLCPGWRQNPLLPTATEGLAMAPSLASLPAALSYTPALEFLPDYVPRGSWGFLPA